MAIVGIALGLAVALLWGTADSVATLASRRLGTLRATFFTQAAGLCGLIAFELLSPSLWSTFTPEALVASVVMGAFTGVCAAGGYWAFYQALKLGPVALVSPLSASSAAVTLALSIALLHERLAAAQGVALALLLGGVLLASANPSELGSLLRQRSGLPLGSRGVALALVAALAFGALDFGLGAAARCCGWFLPVLCTRLYSLLFLTLILTWRVRGSRPRLTYTSARLWRRHLMEAGKAPTRALPTARGRLGLVFAGIAGVVENAGVLLYSVDTLLAQTGVTAVMASNYSLVALLFGCLALRERLALHQVFGIGLVLGGLSLLALG